MYTFCFLVSDALPADRRRRPNVHQPAHTTRDLRINDRRQGRLRSRHSQGVACSSRRAPVSACLAGLGLRRGSIWVPISAAASSRSARRRRHPLRTTGTTRTDAARDEWGVFDPGRDSWSGERRRRACHQRLCAGPLLQPDAGEQTFTIISATNAHRRPQRYFSASRDRVLQGLAGPSAAGLQHRALDGEHHESGRASSATSVTSSVASASRLRRPQRHPRHAIAPGIASVLAWPRSRDGRRILPSVLRIGCLGPGRTRAGSLVQRDVGNSNSALGIKATQLDRTFARRALGMVDADHQGVRTEGRLWRLGAARASSRRASASPTTFSPEQRFTNADNGSSAATPRCGSLTASTSSTPARWRPALPSMTVDFTILSFDAGMKYKGIFLQTEIYNRWLDNFVADGPLPVTSVHDRGFYVQARVLPGAEAARALWHHVANFRRQGCRLRRQLRVRRRIELLSRRTRRNHRLNLQYLDVNGSPVSSTFGYYVGGHDWEHRSRRRSRCFSDRHYPHPQGDQES